jgi:hypothetical protein
MADDVTRTEGKPHDYLTAIAQKGLDAVQGDDVKAIVMVFNTDPENVRGGIALGGYTSDTEALADMFIHLQAMFEAQGKKLEFRFDDGPSPPA